ncbi:hypothetical protein V8F33_009608 [Rhypophila sp. PSN 637]
MLSRVHIGRSQEGFDHPQKQWLAGKWHISHSTHPERYSGNGGLSPVVVVSTRTWDSKSSTESASDQEKITTVFPKFADAFPTVFFFVDKKWSRRWDILAWGKEGQLGPWMIEDGSGRARLISDTSGEACADWRNSYVVMFVDGEVFHPVTDTNGIEIWERFGPTRPLRDETMCQIHDALGRVVVGPSRAEFPELVERLKPVSSYESLGSDLC